MGKMKDEVAAKPIAEFLGLRPKIYTFEAVKFNPDGTTERYDKHRAKGFQRAAAERHVHQQYLDQRHYPTENYALNRRLACRFHQIYGIEVSHTSPTDQNFACHDPFPCMPSSVPSCHGPSLSI